MTKQSKQLAGRQWKKTLAVTGLVTGSLMLGTLSTVQAHADDQAENADATPAVQSTSEQSTTHASQEVALKTTATTPAPAAATPSSSSDPTTPVKDDSVTEAGDPAGTEQPQVPQKQESVTDASATNQPAESAAPAGTNDKSVTTTPANNDKTLQRAAVPEALTVAAPATPAQAAPATDQTIDQWMPDKNLQTIVLKALQMQQKTDGKTQYTDASQITQDDMKMLTTLKAVTYTWPHSDRPDDDAAFYATLNLKDLTGLEKATNLTSLTLSTMDVAVNDDLTGSKGTWQHSSLSDLTPLESLTKLTYLDIEQDSVSDLTPLAKLTNLQTLTANHNFITDISPLANLKKLSYLDLDYNQIKDVTAIGEMPSLNNLTLQENHIKDISPLAKLPDSMDSVMLDNNQIVDLSPIGHIHFTSGTIDASGQTVILDPIEVDTTKDSYDFTSPVVDIYGKPFDVTTYLEGAYSGTSLTSTPLTGTQLTWKGITKYGMQYIVVGWNDTRMDWDWGGYTGSFQGFIYIPYKLVTPKPTDNGNTGTTTNPGTTTTPTVVLPAVTPGDHTTPVTTPTVTGNGQKADKTAFKPFMIYLKQALNRYLQPTFKESKIKKSYRKYTRQTAPTFKVVGVTKSANGNLRYKLANGTYVTARKDFTANLYWQGKHYTKMRVDRTIYEHSATKFTRKNRVRVFKHGQVVTVKRIIHRGYMTRYQLTNGHWITGNKQFITPVKKH
ncbi:DUF5776 domain-containing protein [Levilactobacillus spicheri]|uniref:DUF5776 domain-containing protein n=1 Tax=Levilactobacillus spicheri TaxID=216463 RepID=UPI00069C0A8F|nr:DUF5776 domain-containing protein [Levilactobacillus spicheri]